MPRKRLERQRRDKPQGIRRHYHMHLAALFCEQARQIRRPIRRDRPGHAKNDIARLRLWTLDFGLWTHNSGATALGVRIFSASIMHCVRRKSSRMVSLIIRLSLIQLSEPTRLGMI